MKKPTPALPYIPSSPDVLPPELAGKLHMATRTIYLFAPEGEVQYLVFQEGFNAENDPQLNHVLGSGFSEHNAATSAIVHLERMRLRPADFWPRLTGCTFEQCVQPGLSALQHCCLDASGAKISQADTRDEAARLALHHVLRHCQDMTLQEYRAISITVQVRPGGSRSHGLLFDGDAGQNALRKLAIDGYRNSEKFREAAWTEAQARPPASAASAKRVVRDVLPLSNEQRQEHQSIEALVQAAYKATLSTHTTFSVTRFHSQDEAWVGYVITHPAHINAQSAVAQAYQGYVRQCAEQRAKGQDDARCDEPAIQNFPA